MQLITGRNFVPTRGVDSFNLSAKVQASLLNHGDRSGIFEDCDFMKKYFWISKDSVFFIGTTDTRSQCEDSFIMQFLTRVYENIRKYYGLALSDAVFRQNFDTFCVMLDEMIEGGYPFSTEMSNLESTVVTPASYNLVDKLASLSLNTEPGSSNSLTGVSPEIWWRRTGVFHATNELYLDVTERVNIVISESGKTIHGSISGYIDASSRLSGLPEVSLIFKKPFLFTAENVSFHPSVRIKAWERDKKVSFIPPDGNFTLMKYVIDDPAKAILPFNLQTRIGFDSTNGTILATLIPKPNLLETGTASQNRDGKARIIEEVTVRFKVPKVISNCTMITQTGSARFEYSSHEIVWCIGTVIGSMTSGLKLEGSLSYSSNDRTDSSIAKSFKPTATVQFAVAGWSASGLKVDSVDVSGVNYTPYKGCRYATKSGRIDVRI